MWKNIVKTGQAAHDNMTHAHYMLATQVYKHTLGIYNTYGFSIDTVVARTRLNVTLYAFVYCLSVKQVNYPE
jgi:TATA-box binding protein (TBP) (component of TFIID and TFIIIB)